MLKRVVLLILFYFLLIPSSVFAEEVHIYLFYGNTCPICEEERGYLEFLKSKYKDIRIFEFETYDNAENERYMQEVKEMYHIRGQGVPFTVIGDTAVYGFNQSLGARIEKLVQKYYNEDYYDRVGVYLGMFEDEEIIVSTTSEIPVSSHNLDKENPSNHPKLSILWVIPLGFIAVGFFFFFRLFFLKR